METKTPDYEPPAEHPGIALLLCNALSELLSGVLVPGALNAMHGRSHINLNIIMSIVGNDDILLTLTLLA